MTTVTDYLDSARVSLLSVIHDLENVGQSADEAEVVDVSDPLKSAREAVEELNKAISLLGGL